MYRSLSCNILLLALVTNTFCFNPLNILPSNKDSCPNVTPVENFNITAFGTGVWHEVARFPNTFEVLDKCVSAEYENDGDSFKLRLKNVPFKSIYSIEATAKYADDKRNGNLEFSVEYGWPLLKLDFPLTVLAAKYDLYSIFYTCFSEKLTGITKDFAWIMARSSQLDDSVKAEIEDTIKSISFFDAKKLIWIHYSDSLCKVESLVESLNPLNNLG